MPNPLKAALQKLPAFRKLAAERDRVRDKLAVLKDKLSAEREKGKSKLAVQRAKAVAEQDRLRSEFDAFKKSAGFVPPGHFYSPIPLLDEVRQDEAKIFGVLTRTISGIDLHEENQLNLLKVLAVFYADMPFRNEKQEGLRYYFDNQSYEHSDAILLHCMIRHLKPKRMIEVGSGFSSCVTLDTNDLFFGGSIDLTFIEPYPDLLRSLIKESEQSKIKVIQSRLQDVDLGIFDALQANDILFIDSTHVSRVHSDVNRIFFEILPRLAPGVHVHFHDIFHPFEYPQEWIMEGRAWNEAYLLRAFLQYNRAFRVMLMNTFMEHFHQPFFREKMPLCLKNTGASIWIRRD